MTIIINLTQHKAAHEQLAQGVVDLREPERSQLIDALTFETLPTRQEIESRALFIAQIAAGYDLGGDEDAANAGAEFHTQHAMIGGAPFLMSALESALMDVYVTPVYAFSVRESVEWINEYGAVTKTAIFRHAGFVSAL